MVTRAAAPTVLSAAALRRAIVYKRIRVHFTNTRITRAFEIDRTKLNGATGARTIPFKAKAREAIVSGFARCTDGRERTNSGE